MTFPEKYKIGLAGESAIAKWLISRGHMVLPVYEKIIDTGKGPQLFTNKGNLIAPDMIAFSCGKTVWIEAKHKTAFTWYGIGQKYETGIDLRHYRDYLQVAEMSQYPVWLLFLHAGGRATYSGNAIAPAEDSPSGLFGNNIFILRKNESHRSEKWGKSGMVYWAREIDGGALKKIAEYEEVMNACKAEKCC